MSHESLSPSLLKNLALIKKELRAIGATEIKVNKGYQYVSAFYTIGTQVWYFNLNNAGTFYFRKAKDYKDYTGESNRYTKIQKGMGEYMK